MQERKKALFNTIFKEYIKTAQPVGSTLLVDKYSLGYSAATIRNEMMALEKEGFLYQPHTSAGRIPTEKGYRYYLVNFLEAKELTPKEQELVQRVVRRNKKDPEILLKSLAKLLAEVSQRAVFLSLDSHSTYYTGIANLFAQPEFQQFKLIRNISEIIDHLDEVVSELNREVGKETKILLGRENPFGNECGTVFRHYISKSDKGIVGILSPLRLDYGRSLGLINHICQAINNI